MKDQTCCFTGHRIITESEQASVRPRLEQTIMRLAGDGFVYFGTGGALGFDTLAALTVLSLKPELPQLKLVSVLPCRSQPNGWHGKDREIYDHILSESDKIVYTSEEYHAGCMHKRNRHLVDNSSLCICYLTDEAGGTAYTVRYARKKGLEIINLARE